MTHSRKLAELEHDLPEVVLATVHRMQSQDAKLYALRYARYALYGGPQPGYGDMRWSYAKIVRKRIDAILPLNKETNQCR